MKLKKLDSSLFTFYLWEGGSISTIFGWPHRYASLVSHKEELCLYAVGYCLGEELLVRPKPGWFAVMLEYEGVTWWNHFTADEFHEIFE